MHIAHVTATFPPYYAGTGMVCYHNAIELARRGHQVTVFTSGDPPVAYQSPPQIEVRRLYSLFRLGNAPLLPGLLKLDGFDLIHLHYPFIFGAELIWMVSKVRHIPYVLTYHNDLLGGGLRKWLFETYFALSAPLVFQGAGKLGAVSMDHAAACKATPLFRSRWPDVVELPNGVDVEIFRPDLDGGMVKRKLGIPAGSKVIAFVGALDRAHPFKGVDYLLRVFSGMCDSDAVLLIVGDGKLKHAYIRLAAELGLAGRTFFAGLVAHTDLPLYYAAADVVVLPSSPPESFGMVLIEAMACGRPVIAHDIPGVRMLIDDGVDGYLIQPGDAEALQRQLAQILSMPHYDLLAMGFAGRRKVELKYTWEVAGQRLECIYQQVIALCN